MTINETELKFIHWELDSSYLPNKSDIGISIIQFGGNDTKGECLFSIRFKKRIERNGLLLFSCLAEKSHQFNKELLSIHLLRWLTEMGINEFESRFIEKRKNLSISSSKFPAHDIISLNDDLNEVFERLHSL